MFIVRPGPHPIIEIAPCQTPTEPVVYILNEYLNKPAGIDMEVPDHSIRTQEKLLGDLRQVIETAEELLKSTDRNTSAPYQQARARLAQALQAATEELASFEDAQLERMIDATRSANDQLINQSGEAKLLRAFK